MYKNAVASSAGHNFCTTLIRIFAHTPLVSGYGIEQPPKRNLEYSACDSQLYPIILHMQVGKDFTIFLIAFIGLSYERPL